MDEQRGSPIKRGNLFLALLGVLLLAYFLNVHVYYAMTDRGTLATLLRLSLYVFGFFAWYMYAKYSGIPILLWTTVAAYVLMVWFWHALVFDDYSAEALANARTTLMNIVFLSMIFASAIRRRIDGRALFLIGSTLAVVLNIVDFFDQGEYFEQIEGFGVRAAGFYVNANASAEGILIGMILGVSLLSRQYRVIFCLFCLFGVILTFSRGGVLVWFSIVITLVYHRMLSRTAIYLSITVLLLAGSSIYIVTDSIKDYADIELLTDRLDFISGATVSGEAAQERLIVARRALELGMERPLLGNGPYALLRHNMGQLSHNQYLQLWSDYGLLGLLFLFILLAALRLSSVLNTDSSVLAVFLVLWSFFSHNIFDSSVVLCGVSYVLTRNLSAHSCWSRSRNG